MIIEQVLIDVKPGKIDALLTYARVHEELYRTIPGCHSLVYGRGVEDPDKAIFIVRWTSVSAHEAARSFPAWIEFSTGARPFIANAVAKHFDMIAWPGD